MEDRAVTAWSIEDAQRYGGEVLTGTRIRLRGLRETDLDPLIRWRSDPALDVLQSSSIDPPPSSRPVSTSGRTRPAPRR